MIKHFFKNICQFEVYNYIIAVSCLESDNQSDRLYKYKIYLQARFPM